MEERQPVPARYATKTELSGYLGYHIGMFREIIRGVESAEISEDGEGACIVFTVTRKPNDDREVSLEEAAKMLNWQVGYDRVQARVRVILPDEKHQ